MAKEERYSEGLEKPELDPKIIARHARIEQLYQDRVTRTLAEARTIVLAEELEEKLKAGDTLSENEQRRIKAAQDILRLHRDHKTDNDLQL